MLAGKLGDFVGVDEVFKTNLALLLLHQIRPVQILHLLNERFSRRDPLRVVRGLLHRVLENLVQDVVVQIVESLIQTVDESLHILTIYV